MTMRDRDVPRLRAWVAQWLTCRTARSLRVVPVPVEWHRVGDPTTGVWRPRCALPSAVEADLTQVVVSTLTVVRRVTTRLCPPVNGGCGWRESENRT